MKEYDSFNSKEAYKEHVAPLLKKIKEACTEGKVPFMASFAIASGGKDGKTEHKRDGLTPAAVKMNPKECRVYSLISIVSGSKAVPAAEVPELEPKTGSGKPFESYDSTEAYNETVVPLISSAAALCNEHRIPFFAIFAVKADLDSTQYERYALSAAELGLELKGSELTSLMAVSDGYRAVPASELPEIEFDANLTA